MDNIDKIHELEYLLITQQENHHRVILVVVALNRKVIKKNQTKKRKLNQKKNNKKIRIKIREVQFKEDPFLPILTAFFSLEIKKAKKN